MINAKEFAKLVNKHQNTISKWIKKGMPCIKTDKDYLIDPNEVFNWLKERNK